MDWQDRLRELDAQLAGGELTRSEYRYRRDELLAEASSATALAHHRESRPPTGSFPVAAPPQNLFAPAPQEPPAPLAGTEVFSAASARSRGPRTALAAVAVLAVAAGVLWVVLLKPFASGDTAAPPTASRSLADVVPTPAGRTNPKNGVLTVTAAVDANVLTRSGAEALAASGVLEVVFRATVDGDLGTAVIAGRAASPGAAAAAVERLDAGVRARGFQDRDEPLVDGPVTVKENADNRYINAVFSVGDVVVQISLSQPVEGDQAQLTAALRNTVAAVANALRTG